VAAALKSEHRIPTTEGRPKSEILEQREPMGYYPIEMALDSDLGLRVSFGLRSSVSDLECPGPTLESPCLLATPALTFPIFFPHRMQMAP
jgi:hypothetical protein